MSIATFESPQVGSQRFFPWAYDELLCDSQNDSLDVTFECEVAESQVELEKRPSSNGLPVRATDLRLAKPVRLGAVMLQLLKSYGITDEEIADGIAAYAAKSGVAHAS